MLEKFYGIRSDLRPHLKLFLFHFCMAMKSWTLKFYQWQFQNDTILKTEGIKLN